LGIKYGVPHLQSGGTIINIASVAGLVCGWAPHAYSAAKFGVIGLTKSVALELAERRSDSNRPRVRLRSPRNFGFVVDCMARTPNWKMLPHASQCRTVDHVVVLADGADAKAWYVSLSRARESMHVYTRDKGRYVNR
jgi:NAD(P)-dependent dehydrogenase (short-subunit alcohol dehydrogenase family)